jgi:hypothetical protein
VSAKPDHSRCLSDTLFDALIEKIYQNQMINYENGKASTVKNIPAGGKPR